MKKRHTSIGIISSPYGQICWGAKSHIFWCLMILFLFFYVQLKHQLSTCDRYFFLHKINLKKTPATCGNLRCFWQKACNGIVVKLFHFVILYPGHYCSTHPQLRRVSKVEVQTSQKKMKINYNGQQWMAFVGFLQYYF